MRTLQFGQIVGQIKNICFDWITLSDPIAPHIQYVEL